MGGQLQPTHRSIPNVVHPDDRLWWLIRYFKEHADGMYADEKKLVSDYFHVTRATQPDLSKQTLMYDLSVLVYSGRMEKTYIKGRQFFKIMQQ